MKLEGHLETEHQFKCDKCKVGGIMEFEKVASHLNTCRGPVQKVDCSADYESCSTESNLLVMHFTLKNRMKHYLNGKKEYLEAAKLNKKQNENKLPDWDAVLKSADSTPKPEVCYNMNFLVDI